MLRVTWQASVGIKSEESASYGQGITLKPGVCASSRVSDPVCLWMGGCSFAASQLLSPECVVALLCTCISI